MDLIKTFEELYITKKIPDLRPGDTVRISEKIKEKDRERIQVFEGVLIRKRGSGISTTITVRKIAAGGVGVERIYPLHMPALVKIEVVKRGKVRRAKLYYLRRKHEREARLKEKKLTQEELLKLRYEEKTEKSKSEEVEEKSKVELKKEVEKVKSEVKAEERTKTEESKKEPVGERTK